MGNLSAYGNVVVQTTPVGVIEAFAGINAPAGWLFCDGSAISRTQYPELFSALSTTYGSGDGSTTFNIPDLRGRMPFGKGTHTDVASLGQNEGASLANRRPKHQHNVYDPGHSHSIDESPYTGAGNTVAVGSNPVSYPANSGTRSSTTGIKINPEGASSSTSPQDAPPYLVVNYIIKAVADLPRGGWFNQALPPVVTQLPSNPQIGDEVYYYVTSPYAGYQRQRWNGTTWDILSDSRANGVWQSFTPTLTQSGTLTFNTNYAKYVIFGKTVFVNFSISPTSTGTLNAVVVLGFGTLPTAINAASIHGNFRWFDSGVSNWVGTICGYSTTSAFFLQNGNGNQVGTAGTLNTNDTIEGSFFYEMA